MTYAVGVDIGGTKIAIGLVDENGKVAAHEMIATNLDISPSQMIEEISRVVFDLMAHKGISEVSLRGMGIGSPGPLNSKKGVVICPPNLPNWIHVPIVQEMKKWFSFPILIENDANAAALGEKWIGAAKRSDHFIYITVSTGIGAGIYLDGKLLKGAKGNAGDIGHMVVNPLLGTCTCGQNGCLEWAASGPAIARRASALLGKTVSTEEAFEYYAQKDPRISPLINEVFKDLGVCCVSLINTFDPEMIIIGGGVSKVGTPLFQGIRQYVGKYALNPDGRQTEIIPASLQENAGMIGAASLIFLNAQ